MSTRIKFLESIKSQSIDDFKEQVVEMNLYLPKGASAKVYTDAHVTQTPANERYIYKIYFRTLDDRLLLLTGSQFLFSRGPLGRLGKPYPFDFSDLPETMQISRNKDGKFFFFPVEEK